MFPCLSDSHISKGTTKNMYTSKLYNVQGITNYEHTLLQLKSYDLVSKIKSCNITSKLPY